MFTGLVEDVGTVAVATRLGQGLRLEVRTALPDDGFALGDSVAVDGACLTVDARPAPGRLGFTVGRETVERTTAGTWQPGRRVHLERALRLGDRLGGHLVQGHIDGVGVLERATLEGESLVWWIGIPAALGRYVAEKGSVALDGVSLTVNEVRDASFRVHLIPHTAARTRFAGLAAGERVNVEVDLLARYVERLLGLGGAASGLTLERLRENLFL